MASWFKWGRSIEGQASQQPVRHVCRCGLSSDVVRGDQFQRLTCSACGEVGILLPRDVYPGAGPVGRTAVADSRKKPAAPASRARRANQGVGRARSATDSQRPSSGQPATVQPQPPPQSRPRSAPPPPPDRSPDVTPDVTADDTAGRKIEEPLVTRRGIQAEPTNTPRRRRITPFRLVSVCMALLVGVTGWWSVREFQLSSDASQLGDLIRSGLEALESGDFTTASSNLGKAAGVLDRLGRDDPAADVIRHRSREASAADGLVGESLVEILDVADRLQRSGDQDAWARQFERDHRGRWLVMQSVLERPGERLREPEAEGGDDTTKPEISPGAFEAEFPFSVGDRPVRLVGRLPALVRLSGWSDPGNENPRPVIFAAQLEACRLDVNTDTWQIELSTDTAFLWTDVGSIRHLGFLPDEFLGDAGISELLDLQATAVGLEVDSIAVDGSPADSSSDASRVSTVDQEGGQ